MITLTLLLVTLLLASCAPTEEDRIEDVVDDLVSALNDHSLEHAGQLYHGGLQPLNNDGDSSTIYRLLLIEGGRDFAVSDLTSVVIDDRAQTTFRLSGTMTRGDSTVGEMGMLLRMELEREGDQWRFIPGQEKKETGL